MRNLFVTFTAHSARSRTPPLDLYSRSIGHSLTNVKNRQSLITRQIFHCLSLSLSGDDGHYNSKFHFTNIFRRLLYNNNTLLVIAASKIYLEHVCSNSTLQDCIQIFFSSKKKKIDYQRIINRCNFVFSLFSSQIYLENSCSNSIWNSSSQKKKRKKEESIT